MEKKLLIIVDAQYDFINGSLPTEGAEEIIQNLVNYLHTNINDYEAIICTQDMHPDNHMSFIENGGIFPKHCVEYTHGADIYSSLSDVLKIFEKPEFLLFLPKGTNPKTEEYSIMQNSNGKIMIEDILHKCGITEVHVCGLLGNYCVGDTLKDLSQYNEKIKIVALDDFILSNDDGSTLEKIIKDNHITKINIKNLEN